MAKRAKGGRISLTAFEAQWLFLVIDTCGSIGADTMPYVGITQPKGDPWELWQNIVDKVAMAAPDFDEDLGEGA